MSQASFYRIGAVAMIAGTILALVFNVVHGRASDATNTEAQLRLAADKGPWIGIHLGLFVGVLLITGGLLALSRSLDWEVGSAWARFAAAGALIGGTLFAALMATDGIVLKHVADSWAAGGADRAALFQLGHLVRESNAALLSLWTIEFLGGTLLMYGLALGHSALYPRWAGPAGVGLGVAGLLDGAALALGGFTFGAFNVGFTVVSILATVWLFALGVLLWRRADKLPT